MRSFVAREVFGSQALVDEIQHPGTAMPIRRRAEPAPGDPHAGRARVPVADQQPAPPMDSEATVDFFDVLTQQVTGAFPSC